MGREKSLAAPQSGLPLSPGINRPWLAQRNSWGSHALVTAMKSVAPRTLSKGHSPFQEQPLAECLGGERWLTEFAPGDWP